MEAFSSRLESNSPLLIDKQIEMERILERLKDELEAVARLKALLASEEADLIAQRELAELIKVECDNAL